jgi:two-component sensor histidine kinase
MGRGNKMSDLERLSALKKTGLLDSPAEARFDRLTRLASNALGTEIALISLIDQDRQWFKSKQGLEASETPIDQAFCRHTIKSKDVMVVNNAADDSRFAENPLVTGDPNIAFYAGAPLITKGGHAIGTLCVIDSKPRPNFSKEDQQILSDIAASVVTEIEANAQTQIIDDLNLINEELQHRMGNMYAHVSSLISLMGRKGMSQEDFAKRLRERITTLAQTQALIASNRYKSAPLSAIFETTLAPFLTAKNKDRVRIGKEKDFNVSARGAFTLTLMLNELATNAVKHGALKEHDGTVDFHWLEKDGLIKFEWKETVSHAIVATGEHKGFGSQILARIVPLDFQGDAEHEILPSGLLYKVSAKYDRVGTPA